MDLNAQTVVYKETHRGGRRVPEEESNTYMLDYNDRRMYTMNHDGSKCTNEPLPPNESALPPEVVPEVKKYTTVGPLQNKKWYYQINFTSKAHNVDTMVDGNLGTGRKVYPERFQMELKGRSKGYRFLYTADDDSHDILFNTITCG